MLYLDHNFRVDGDAMRDHESEEMYLETILLLKDEKVAVRSIDVAEKLGYAKSSVSRGVNLLQDRGYIKIDDDGFIGFTEAGEQKACKIFDRHRVLTELDKQLGRFIFLNFIPIFPLFYI